MRVAVVALLTTLLLQGCAFGSDGEPDEIAKSDFVVGLIRLGGDREYGRVGLDRIGNAKTRVLIDVAEQAATRLLAEIHTGNCDVLGVAVYRLSPVRDGASETTVNVAVDELRRAGYTVMIRKSDEGVGGLCGDLAKSQPPSAAPTFD
jgi:hypothetical protein